jgi:hypothetical protein
VNKKKRKKEIPETNVEATNHTQFISPKVVLVPHLKRHLWPTRYSSHFVVNVDRM